MREEERRTIDDVEICHRSWTVWVFVQKADAIVCALPDARVEGHLAQQLDACLFSQPLGTARGWLEYLTGCFAARAYETGHVLDQAEDGEADLAAKVDLFVDVLQGDLLWGCDEDGTIDAGVFEVLDDAEVLVRCAGRGVDDEIVDVAPVYVFEELGDEAILLWPPPHDGITGGGEHESDGHDGEIVLDIDRRPARGRGMDLF